MAEDLAGIPGLLQRCARFRHLLVPLSFLGMLAVLIVPLPPAIMDLLISANISLAIVILLTTIYTMRPLDFSVFPALLLATTLFRLVLNVASTRLILSADASSPEAASAVAGHVIEAFGHFVAGESAIVGVIIFIILVVVQFVVITKGATRMSEVAARFTLDALPGKQMAIDADLAAGLIDETEARDRREQIMREADFYGAMDGASKFVRGDAIAGLIITVINIVGGFAIGAFENGWTFQESISIFTMLTIGDGLVSQIPSFVIAVAAGLIVARASDRAPITEEIPRQLASQPIALFMMSGALVALSLTPLPTLPLFVTGTCIGGLAWCLRKSEQHTKAVVEAEVRAESAAKLADDSPVEDLLTLDALEIEVGYGLVPLVDTSRGGDLLDRIAMIRRQLAAEIGLVVPPVRIRDNVLVDANGYRIKLRGAVIGSGTVYPNLLMAMDSGLATGPIDGIAGQEPAFGLEALWIEPATKTRAEAMNYTVVDPASVMATHLTELVRKHAHEILSREEVGHLLEQLKTRSPKLVEEVVPGIVKPGEIQKVLQNLLRERVPIRDLEAIIETLGDWAPHTKDIDVLTEYVRNTLRRTISGLHAQTDDDGTKRLFCVTLDPEIADLINGYIDRGAAGTSMSIPPQVANQIATAVGSTAEPLLNAGHQLVVLTAPTVRAQLKQILDPHLPTAVVLSYNEIVDDLDVNSMGLVQLSQPVGAGAAGRGT